MPVDFEASGSWRKGLETASFDAARPAIVVSTGVSMYLNKDANAATLREVASLAPGSTFAMSFLLPLQLADAETRPGLEMAVKGARASGTPFISFFPRRRSSRWPATPASAQRTMSQPTNSPRAISPAAPMDSALPQCRGVARRADLVRQRQTSR
ncbi:class I SAM-dependent methyltransferase [Bradyrhizobium sp. ORS 86]|uniref:class I SAM-dependent methyltransferase n=1 Tax=Bradyrhizobium sp. ORS 86 TaxID=1685970 RepID=UPI00388D871D